VIAQVPDGFETVEVHKGHCWGVVRCLTCNEVSRIWSTPRVPENNARDLRNFVERHQKAHREEER
jgi:hypothetical protein